MLAGEPRHLQAFLLGWLVLAAGATWALACVRTPYIKWWLTRTITIVAGVVLLGGVWAFAPSPQAVVFGVIGISAVAMINFYTIRICPHCAKTIYPRQQLALGLCPRCGTNLAARHERIASWRETA